MQNSYSFKLLEDNTPALAKKDSLSRFSTITSNDNSAACGVNLEVGTTYLLKGSLHDSPSVMLCGFYAKTIDHVPTQSEAKTLFDALYLEQC